MSSEWWSLLVVFWGLYLADGLRGGRRDRFHFYGWFATRRPRGSVVSSSWFFTPPIPSAWLITAEDLPVSLAPEGVVNWPSASASRPPPLPDHALAFPWESIERVEDRSGHIFVNGRRFAASTPALTAAALGALARELAPLSAAERAARLRSWHAARFSTDRLRRRLRSVHVRAHRLVFLNTTLTLLLAAISAHLLLDGAERLPDESGAAFARNLPWLLLVCAGLHVVAIGWLYRLHRRIYPRAGQERAGAIFTALFVPAQALRMRLHLTAKLAEGLHPLAVALTVSRPSLAQAIARDTLRDLRWPRLPATLPADIVALVRSANTLIEPVVLSALDKAGEAFSPARLLVPPAPESPASRAYCPRCGDQFIRPDAHCAHGIPLAPFPKTDRTG